jgi:CDP-6-deoxy-D-xylo-4-hexulose-3-dehydrase
MNPANPENLRNEILELVSRYGKLIHGVRPFFPGVTYLPATGKLIDEKELISMVDASLDGWLTSGRFNDEFERVLSNFIGVKHALTVNSGSSANLVAFNTLTSTKLNDRAIRPGDEVIGVAAAFPTTVNPIIQFGAVPVFVDVDIGTYNIDVSKIEDAITPKTKAIFIAHTMGNPFNLKAVKDICEKHSLWLIEDCCDALGAEFNGAKVGTFGDLATLSFYPAHHVTMGEGGAVLTNNDDLRAIAESFRDWGRDCYCRPGKDNTCGKRYCWKLGDLPEGYDHKYIYSHAGYNLKITDMQAACGLAQLKKIETFIDLRRFNFQYLHDGLKSCEEFLILPHQTPCSNPSWFGFPITVKKNSPVSRLELLQYLEQEKIGSRLIFSGNITKQPYFINTAFRAVGPLLNTDIVMNDTFALGVQPALTKEMLDYVILKVNNFFGFGF